MPLIIKQLRCRVTVRTGDKKASPLGRDEKSPRPGLVFALPATGGASQTGPLPGQTASENTGATMGDGAQNPGGKSAAQPRRVDARQVADRVYDLMREEARIGRLRNGG